MSTGAWLSVIALAAVAVIPVLLALLRSRPKGPPPLGHARQRPAQPSPAPPEQKDDRDVQFTAYPPLAIRLAEWYPLLVFAHKGAPFRDETGRLVDATAEVERQADILLGHRRPDFTQLRTFSARAVSRGNALRFVPRLEGATFNPPEATVNWLEPLHRQEFRFLVERAPERAVLSGSITIFQGIMLVAEIPLRIAISENAPITGGPNVPTPAVHFRRIFPSYSHQDFAIVDSVIEHVETTGDEYLRDVVSLRSGQVWREELLKYIDQADVFQLFWSSNSMRSRYVRDEWEYALKSSKPGFVRPLYWEEPRPEDRMLGLPPAALERLHFARLSIPQPPAGPSSDAFPPVPRGPMPRPSAPVPPWQGQPPPPALPRGSPRRTGLVAVSAGLLLIAAILLAVYYLRS